jgi:adenine-specific DNA-methyltransferase
LILEKIKKTGTRLDDYIEGKIYRGVLTGYNKAFVIDESTKDKLISDEPKCKEIIKPFLEGKDVKRYQKPLNRKFIIFTRRGIDIEEYPAIKRHLMKFKPQLIPGVDGGRKAGKYQWFEFKIQFHIMRN